MRKFIFVFIFMCVLQIPVYGDTPEAISAPIIPIKKDLTILGVTIEVQGQTKLKDLISLYNKGLEREKLNSYESALAAYNGCLSISINILNSNYANQYITDIILPFAVGCAYKKAIITQALIGDKMVQLYDQLKMYEDTDKWINEIMTTISNLKLKNVRISDTRFGLLYFARSYNKMGWGYALLNGSLWRRYLVYPPSGVVGMVRSSTDGLNKIFPIYNISSETADKDVEKYFSKPLPISESLTFRLCYGLSDLNKVKVSFKNQIGKDAMKVVGLSKSEEVKKILSDSEQLQTFEDIVNNPRAAQLINIIRKMLEEMKQDL